MSTLLQLEQDYLNAHKNHINVICHFIGIPLIIGAIATLPFYPRTGLVLFALGWLLQFVGHLFEGQKPKFFEDPRYLLVGPLCLAKSAWKKIASQRE